MTEHGKLNLMLIENQDIVFATFPRIAQGLEAVLKHSHQDTTMSAIFQKLMATPPHLHLWIGMIGSEYVGFMTTRFEDIPQGGKFLDIIHVYIKPGMDRNLFWQGLDEVEGFARKYGYTYIRFWTERKGLARRLENTGWKPKYVEYIKEV